MPTRKRKSGNRWSSACPLLTRRAASRYPASSRMSSCGATARRTETATTAITAAGARAPAAAIRPTSADALADFANGRRGKTASPGFIQDLLELETDAADQVGQQGDSAQQKSAQQSADAQRDER